MVPLDSGLSLSSACASRVTSSSQRDSPSLSAVVPRDDSDTDLGDALSSTSEKNYPHHHRTTPYPSQPTFLNPSADQTASTTDSSTSAAGEATAVNASAVSSAQSVSSSQAPRVGLLIGISLAGILVSLAGVVMLLWLLRRRRRQVTFVVVNPPNPRDSETVSRVDSLNAMSSMDALPSSASAKKPVPGSVKRPRIQIPPQAQTSLRKSEIGRADPNDQNFLDPPKSSASSSLSSATSEIGLLPRTYTNTSRVARYTLRYW